MLVCVFLCASCTRDRGCSAHPAFPAPSVFEGQCSCKTRAHRAARIRMYTISPDLKLNHELQAPSLRAQRSNPSRRITKERMDCFATLAMTDAALIPHPCQHHQSSHEEHHHHHHPTFLTPPPHPHPPDQPPPHQ